MRRLFMLLLILSLFTVPMAAAGATFDTYVAATRALDAAQSVGDIYQHPKAGVAAQRAVLRKNARALALLRKGMQSGGYRQPPPSLDNDTYPYYVGYRTLGRLLVIESRVKSAQGDRRGALSSALDGMQFGNEISRGAPLLGVLLGQACEGYARTELWSLLNATRDARLAREATRRLAALSGTRVPFAETLIVERDAAQRLLQDMLDHPKKYAPAKGSKDRDDLSNSPPVVLKAVKAEHARVTNLMIANARKPYSPETAALPEVRGVAAGELSSMLYIFKPARFRSTQAETQHHLLTLAFAIKAYKLERGSPPDRLTTLASTYLAKLPADPFGRGAAFQYRRTAKGYLLYSIGPDGRDNKGTSIANRKAGEAQRRIVLQNSTGDIVVGVNTF